MKNLQILSIITWLPTLGAIVILAVFKKDQASAIKKFATAWFGLAFIASLFLLKYDRAIGGMQFLEDHQWIPVIGARYQMGADGVAVLLIVLTTLLGAIAALSSWKYIEKREKEYYVLLLLLQTAVVGVFTSMDLFLFYLFFEVSLVPMYFLIGIWGGENRLYAAIKFFLYTLVGSVVMLLGVLKIYLLTQDTALTGQITQATIDLLAGNKDAAAMVSSTLQAAAQNGTGTFNILYMQALGSVLPMGTLQVLLFFAFALGFAIKVPMFPFHTWLPDAHVEAPTAGSVILAGILLKLGTYGFYRFNIPMFPAASADESYFGSFGVRSVMVFLAIVGIIYGALAAMYFVVKKDGDVKKLVAYSSVSSMGIVMLGLFALNPNGLNGAVLHMINHGIYSAALFLLVGIIYERRHTRNVAEFGGLSHVMPGYAAIFLAMVMTAIGLPLLCVFISEFLSLRGAFEANPAWAAWGSLGIILNAGYMLWLYQRMFFGTIDNPKNEKLVDLSAREWIYMTPLVVLSLWIGVYPKPFLNYIERPVNAVVRHVRPSYPIPGMPPTLQTPQRAALVNEK
ncbi:MAG TPA: Fe-S-binding domain-containing protein [Blastocatellia bacterium]|jgi:NADH-quinone oxidoreductase subunit M|nr:Fe-S-binding domain-containing protein [Blastocatellia bacterium]HCX29061.1 Fe-S-binding domain-containing protein [Blastocatellia bacterium]